MEIDYSTNKLARQFATSSSIDKAFGDRAKRLKMRLDVLKLADSLADVPDTPPTRRHELDHDLAGHYAVDVTANYRLIFRPNHDPLPILEGGSVDLERVTSITIVDLVDYH